MLSQKPIYRGRSGKSVRGFPGHLRGSGRQLPKMDIEIRFIVQDHSFRIVVESRLCHTHSTIRLVGLCYSLLWLRKTWLHHYLHTGLRSQTERPKHSHVDHWKLRNVTRSVSFEFIVLFSVCFIIIIPWLILGQYMYLFAKFRQLIEGEWDFKWRESHFLLSRCSHHCYPTENSII